MSLLTRASQWCTEIKSARNGMKVLEVVPESWGWGRPARRRRGAPPRPRTWSPCRPSCPARPPPPGGAPRWRTWCWDTRRTPENGKHLSVIKWLLIDNSNRDIRSAMKYLCQSFDVHVFHPAVWRSRPCQSNLTFTQTQSSYLWVSEYRSTIGCVSK